MKPGTIHLYHKHRETSSTEIVCSDIQFDGDWIVFTTGGMKYGLPSGLIRLVVFD